MAINFPASLDSFATAIDNVTDVMAADINDMRDAVEALEAKVGITSSVVDTSLDYKVNNFFVENTRKILLYENTAPTGWEIENTLDDKVVMITKGSVAGGESGGGVHSTGTWTQPTHTHDLPFALDPDGGGIRYDYGGGFGSSASTFTEDRTTGSSVSSAIRNYAKSQTGSTVNTWRPAAYCCIIAKYTGA